MNDVLVVEHAQDFLFPICLVFGIDYSFHSDMFCCSGRRFENKPYSPRPTIGIGYLLDSTSAGINCYSWRFYHLANLPNHPVSNKIIVDVVIMTVGQTGIAWRLDRWCRVLPTHARRWVSCFENFDSKVLHFDEFQKLPITEEMLEAYPVD